MGNRWGQALERGIEKIRRLFGVKLPGSGGNYQPSSADMEYRDSAATSNPFDQAKLLRAISHEYLAVLAQSNAGPNSAGMKAMIDVEISRRGFAAARSANRIALASVALALASLVISILS